MSLLPGFNNNQEQLLFSFRDATHTIFAYSIEHANRKDIYKKAFQLIESGDVNWRENIYQHSFPVVSSLKLDPPVRITPQEIREYNLSTTCSQLADLLNTEAETSDYFVKVDPEDIKHKVGTDFYKHVDSLYRRKHHRPLFSDEVNQQATDSTSPPPPTTTTTPPTEAAVTASPTSSLVHTVTALSDDEVKEHYYAQNEIGQLTQSMKTSFASASLSLATTAACIRFITRRYMPQKPLASWAGAILCGSAISTSALVVLVSGDVRQFVARPVTEQTPVLNQVYYHTKRQLGPAYPVDHPTNNQLKYPRIFTPYNRTLDYIKFVRSSRT